MSLGPKYGACFSVTYLLIFIYMLYLTYLNIRNGGVYPGNFPEGEGSELLEFYSSHPLHGMMNLIINVLAIMVYLLYVYLVSDPQFRKEPTKVHLLNLNNLLCIIAMMLYAQEWLTAERTSVIVLD